MNKICSKNEEVFILENFLSKKECKKYFNMIRDIGYQENILPWNERVIDITKDNIVNKVTKYINNFFNLNLIANQAEIQNHHVNSFSNLHIHDHLGREHIEYNSLIYLNDDFDQGHFITKNGIKIKPKLGMLTFFNGQKIWHGVEKVLKKDRKTIIFWWRKNEI
jgi:hypothetical protein